MQDRSTDHRKIVSFQVVPVIGKTARDILHIYPRALVWSWPAWLMTMATSIVWQIEIAFQRAPFFYYLVLTDLRETQSQVWGVIGVALVMPVVAFTTRSILEGKPNGDGYLSVGTWRRFLRAFFLLLVALTVFAVLLSLLYLIWLLIDELDPRNRLRSVSYIVTALSVWVSIFTLATRLICVMPLVLVEKQYPIAASWYYTRGYMKKLVILLLIIGPTNAFMTTLYSLVLVFIFRPLAQIPEVFCDGSAEHIMCSGNWLTPALALTLLHMAVAFYFVVGSATSANVYLSLRQLKQRKND